MRNWGYAVAKKQILPALKCQMQRAEIILHVKRVLRKHVTSIFDQSLNHGLIGEKACVFFIDWKDDTHNLS